MSERLYNAIVLVSLAGLMLLGVGLGCANSRPAVDPPAVGEAITRAQVHVETAQRHVDQVKPSVRGLDLMQLVEAGKNLAAAGADLLEAGRLNREKDQILAAQADQITALRTQVANEQDQWFGDKLHRYASWVVGISLGLFVGYELLAVWLGGGPLAKTFTGAGGLVLNLIGSLMRKIKGGA